MCVATFHSFNVNYHQEYMYLGIYRVARMFGIHIPSRPQIIGVAILTGVCFLGLFSAKELLPFEYVIGIIQPPSPGSEYSAITDRNGNFSGSKADRKSSLHNTRYRHTPYDTNITLYELPINKIQQKSVKGSILNYLANYKNPCWFEDNTTQLGLRCLPYFLQLGVAKCGSSSLFQQLVKHPDIAEPIRKELFYWNKPNHYANLVNYLAKFRTASMEIFKSKDTSGYHHKITFEATPAYFTSTGLRRSIPGNTIGDEPTYTLAHTMYSIFPDMRFIVILRNPTDRLFSHYHHFHKHGFGAQDFHDHVVAGIQMMKHCLANRTLRSCAYDTTLNARIRQHGRIMLHYGMYYIYAKEWLSVFPRHQILFIKSEEFYANSTSVMRETFNFLGLAEPSSSVIRSIDEDMNKYYTQQKSLDVKKQSYRAKMFPKTRVILDDFYQPYNQKLAEFLGSDKFLFLK